MKSGDNGRFAPIRDASALCCGLSRTRDAGQQTGGSLAETARGVKCGRALPRGERLARGLRVTARHGIADEQHARQLRIVGDEVPRIRDAADFITLVERQVEAAEVFLQRALPSLLLRRQYVQEVLQQR